MEFMYNMVSETVRSAFPRSSSKQHGKFHTTYVHGIEANESDPADPDSTLIVNLKQSLEAEKDKNAGCITTLTISCKFKVATCI